MDHKQTSYPLTPEARALLERMVQERDQAQQRLDVAVLAIRAALGVPLEWQLRNLDEGFVSNVTAPTEA